MEQLTNLELNEAYARGGLTGVAKAQLEKCASAPQATAGAEFSRGALEAATYAVSVLRRLGHEAIADTLADEMWEWSPSPRASSGALALTQETLDVIELALDQAKAVLEEEGCNCGDASDIRCALCLVVAAEASLEAQAKQATEEEERT